MKSNFSAFPHQLFNIHDGQFGTVRTYLCDKHSLNECLKDNFFISVKGNLLPGDTIRIVEVKDNKVWAFIEVMVVMIKNNLVLVYPMCDVKYFKYEDETKQVTQQKEIAEQYVTGDAIVKWNGGKKKYEVRVGNERVAMISDKEEANAVARGDKPLPALS